VPLRFAATEEPQARAAVPAVSGRPAERAGVVPVLAATVAPAAEPMADADERDREPAAAIIPQAVKVDRIVLAPREAAVQQQPVAPQPPEPQAAPPHVLEHDEVAALYDRSLALVNEGDIASARLTLTRAAEAGDARAALALGATYDPDTLRKLGVLGVAADPEQAQSWYKRAVALGSAEAVTRLERLAQAAR
jgi:TPR repeat protein